MADINSAPGQPPALSPSPDNASSPPVVVKKYANRRLYNTETSSYITLENLAEMIRAGRDFAVYDAKSGEDITRGVLTQIIVEEESKGSAMLPTGFLRQLIGFYGGNLQGVVPRYLEHSMASFARQQQQMRQMVERTLSPFLPSGVEEMSRQNLALFERAMSMFNPFHRATDAEAGSEPGAEKTEGAEPSAVEGVSADAEASEAAAQIQRLKHEVESLRTQLAAAHAAAVIPASAVPPSVAIPENVISDPPSLAKRKPVRKPSAVETP